MNQDDSSLNCTHKFNPLCCKCSKKFTDWTSFIKNSFSKEFEIIDHDHLFCKKCSSKFFCRTPYYLDRHRDGTRHQKKILKQDSFSSQLPLRFSKSSMDKKPNQFLQKYTSESELMSSIPNLYFILFLLKTLPLYQIGRGINSPGRKNY